MTASEWLVKSPLHRPLLGLRGQWEYRRVMATEPTPVRTAYCISPYKTGTTFVSGLFSSDYRVEHEPLHYATLNRLQDDDYLARRASFLDLDMECSGFFSGQLARLRRFAPDAPVVYLQRAPEEWISSVIGYFSRLSSQIHYNYVCRLFFDGLVAEPIDRFEHCDNRGKAALVENLLRFWIAVYEEAAEDSNVLIMPLQSVGDRLGELEAFVGIPVDPKANPWKRANARKKSLNLDDFVDMSVFREQIETLSVR